MTKSLSGVLMMAVLVGSYAAPMVTLAETPAQKKPHWEFPQIPGVHARMEKLIADKEIAGAVTLVVTPDKIVHLNTAGEADIATHQPIQPNSVFWIASMTKPITGLAICKLEEERKLKLEDPVEKYIPEFQNIKNKDGEPVQITIMQLLTHTSGLHDPKPADLIDVTTLAGLIPYYVAGPVNFAPGSKWQYCQSGINTAGRIVEIVSGMAFPDYLQQEIFAPLGMVDTTFYLTEEQATRLAKTYARTKEGELELTKDNKLLWFGKSPTSHDRYPAANGGLFSTALDYGRFCQMLLNEGELKGKRVVRPETVTRLRTVHTADDIKTGFTPGNGWGVATCVVREPQEITSQLSPGTYGHGGAFGTQAWIDPDKKLALILMVQRSNFENADKSVVREAFQDAVLSK